MARVLILDDDLASLAVAKRAVRAAGHDAIAVTSAADASAALAAPLKPDVLLASPSADAGEALALAEQTRSDSARSGTAVLLIGDEGAAGIPSVSRPLDGPSVGAQIAKALASRPALRTGSPPAAPAAASSKPPRSPAATAESALRALFRRRAPAQAPPAAPPPPAGGEADSARPSLESAAAAVEAAGSERAGDAVARRLATPPRSVSLAPVELARVVSLARSADYFAVLGVARTVSATEIRDAADRLLGDLDARLLSANGGESTELREARQVVIDARDVLSDDVLRVAYLKGIEDVADSTPS